MSLDIESERHLDVSNHIILVLDILGYSDQILENDETQMLQQFDSLVTTVKNDIAKMSDINYRIQWKMYSDNFLIFAPLPEDEDFLHLTIKGVLTAGAMLQLRLTTEYGFMSRGGCCFGNLYADDFYVFGSGLVNSHRLECRHREPTISVTSDVVEKLMSRELGKYDPLESMILIKITEDGGYIDYLRYVVYIASRTVMEGMYNLRIDDVVHYHKIAYEKIICPRLTKSIETNKDEIGKVGSLKIKNRWFINYHNSVCEELCFPDEMIDIPDSDG